LNNLLQRTLSGTIYLVIIIGSLFLGKYAFGTMFLIIGLLALSEFYHMMDVDVESSLSITCISLGIGIFVLSYLTASGLLPLTYLWLVLVFPIVVFIVALYQQKMDILDMSKALLGLFYIMVPISVINFLAFEPNRGFQYTHRIVLGILILVWVNDTGAYVAGSLFGRHKLFPRVSPKKSWEGLIGGTVFTLAGAFLMTYIVRILTTTDWMVIGVLTSIFGVYGDLCESFLKRIANKKDSGALIPGHGGMLDRIDSILFVMPVVLAYLMITGF
jgi:phosphatidate cytidylyltransferase